MPNATQLFTIGHSNQEWSSFVQTLSWFSIPLVVDVRSRPHSSRHPQFSQPEFEGALREAMLKYLFLGEELGGRPADAKAYRDDGMVDYRARRQSYGFRAGIERVLKELEAGPLVLMCAEEDPLTCHRFLMICPELVASGIAPQHIRKGSIIETQSEAEDRLLVDHGFGDVTRSSLFAAGREEALEQAYVRQAEKCAFRVDPSLVEYW